MKKIDFKKGLVLYPLTALALTMGSSAFAHTGIKDTAMEGTTQYTGFTITHGCATPGDTDRLRVIAQSVVFPNVADADAFQVNADGSETATTLGDHIIGAIGGVTSLSPGIVQDKSVFLRAAEISDANGSVHAFNFTRGKLDTAFTGVIPFRVRAPKFDVASCAKSLKIRIAIANFCSTSATNGNRSDVWIGHTTPVFNDLTVMPRGVDSNDNPFWPTMTIKRDLAANPLAAACDGGFDVAVQPSDADIDQFLPLPGFWPAN